MKKVEFRRITASSLAATRAIATKIVALLVVLSLVLSSLSCSKDEISALELCRVLDALFENEDRGAVFYSSNELDNVKLLDAEALGRLYIGKYQAPTCYDRISDCAARLPLDESGFEIHVLIAFNRSDTDELVKLLEKRLDSMTSNELLLYAPDEYLENYRTAEIYVKGKFVFLLSTPNNELCKKTVASLV